VGNAGRVRDRVAQFDAPTELGMLATLCKRSANAALFARNACPLASGHRVGLSNGAVHVLRDVLPRRDIHLGTPVPGHAEPRHQTNFQSELSSPLPLEQNGA
jgi:hypothetical protein